jgi:PPM family protein phosphatase
MMRLVTPASPRLGLRVALRSATGPHRTDNQDSAAAATDFVVIADGVGGHAGGDVASRTVVSRLVERLQQDRACDLDDDALLLLIAEANAALADLSRDPQLTGLATTLTALFCDTSTIRVAHIGDSRAYLAHGGETRRVTRDDSYVQMLLDTGVIDDEQAFHHPNRNLLTQVLDGDPVESTRVHLQPHSVELADRWLLCSDGLTDTLDEEYVLEVLVQSDVETAADRLLTAALAADAHDNVTLAVCDVVEFDASAAREVEVVGAAQQGPTVSN